MPRGIKHQYDMEVVEYIKANFSGHTSKELVDMVKQDLGKDVDNHEIYLIRQKYSLKNGVDTRFKKGCQTWNKGLKGYIGANKTSFKKGNRPPNTKPIGTERVEKDGYVFVKVGEKFTNSRNDNWMPKQQVIYEQYHNVKVPKGSIVIFADNDRTNFDIDNLVMVTRSELLYLNQNRMRYDNAELTKSSVMVARLIRSAAERKKKV